MHVQNSRQSSSHVVAVYRLIADETSRGYKSVEMELNSRQAQHVFKRVFTKVDDSFYRLLYVLPDVDDSKRTDQVVEILENMVEDTYEKIVSAKVQAETLREAHKLTGGCGYTKTRTFKAKISTPLSDQFMEMIQILDELVAIVDHLWVSRLVAHKEKKNVTTGWEKRLLKLAQDVRDLAMRAVKAAADAEMSQRRRKSAKSKRRADIKNRQEALDKAQEEAAKNEQKMRMESLHSTGHKAHPKNNTKKQLQSQEDGAIAVGG